MYKVRDGTYFNCGQNPQSLTVGTRAFLRLWSWNEIKPLKEKKEKNRPILPETSALASSSVATVAANNYSFTLHSWLVYFLTTKSVPASLCLNLVTEVLLPEPSTSQIHAYSGEMVSSNACLRGLSAIPSGCVDTEMLPHFDWGKNWFKKFLHRQSALTNELLWLLNKATQSSAPQRHQRGGQKVRMYNLHCTKSTWYLQENVVQYMTIPSGWRPIYDL